MIHKLYNFNLGILLLLLSLSTASAVESDKYAGDKKVTFELITPDIIVAGEPFNIQFVLNAKGKDLHVPTPQGLQISYGPAISNSSSVSIINGNITRSVTTTFSYTLIAPKEGTYTIPEATVKSGSATYRTSPKQIKVFTAEAVYGADAKDDARAQSKAQVRASERISDNDFVIKAIPSKTKVYEQEGLLVTYKLYSTHPDISLTSANFPDFQDFVKQEVDTPAQKRWDTAELNGRVYYVVDLYKVILFPQKTGKISIPSGTFDLMVQVKVNDPVSDFFGSFLDQYTRVKKEVRSQPFSIDVKALPTPSPEGFSGAVGQFELAANVPTTVLKTNESFQIELTLKGKGNIKLTSLPSIEFPEGFEQYDPQENEDITVLGSGVSGTKTKTLVAVPRYAGDYEIQAIPFAYFDPVAGQYRTTSIPTTRVHVDKGDDTAVTQGTLTDRDEVKYLGQDIRYLKSEPGSATHQRISTAKILACYSGVILLALIIYLVYRLLLSQSAETAELRSRRAGAMAKKYLKIAEKKRSSGDDPAYYEALLTGVNNYISAKFHIDRANLSKEYIQSTMLNAGLSPELIEQTLGTLSTLEMARYTPSEGTSQKEDLYAQAANVIDAIQATKYKYSKK